MGDWSEYGLFLAENRYRWQRCGVPPDINVAQRNKRGKLQVNNIEAI